MRVRAAAGAFLLAVGGCRCPSRPATEGDASDCFRGDGVIRVASASPPNTLDWGRSSENSAPNYPVMQALMRGLTRLDAHHVPVPDLAERWEVALTADAPPRQVYTFHLGPHLTWSDGTTPLVARDFVFAWRRVLAVGLETAELNDLLGARQAVEAREAQDPARLAAALDRLGVEALDEHTLRVTLASPRSYFLSRVATVYPLFPVPSRLLEGKPEAEVHAYFEQPTASSPVVVGSYRVAGWDRSSEGAPLRLEPNPFGPAAGAPGLPRAIVVVQSSLGPLLYRRCEVDFLFQDEPWALGRTAALQRQELLSVYWLGLNAGLLPLPLRQAIALTLDRPALLEGLLPAARPAFGLLPPDLPGAVAEGDARAEGWPRRDLARARALVASSGYDGRPLTLLVRTQGTFLPEVAIADGVRRQLADIGLHVTLAATADFAGDIRDPEGRIRHPLFLRRIGADYAHPQTFFTPFAPTGLNYTGFEALDGGATVQAFQALVERGAAEDEPGRATSDFTAAQRLLLWDAAVAVPLYYPDRYFQTRRWLSGLGVDAFNFLTLRDARVVAAP
jgi:ABC-type transport system substrate-binding protein